MYMIPEASTIQVDTETLDVNPNSGKAKALVASTTSALEKTSLSGEDNFSNSSTAGDGGRVTLTKSTSLSTHGNAVPASSVNPWKKTSCIQPAKILSEEPVINSKSDVYGKSTVESDSGCGSGSDKAHVKKKNWVALDTLSTNIMQQTFSVSNGNKSAVTSEGKEQAAQPRRSRMSITQPVHGDHPLKGLQVGMTRPRLRSLMVAQVMQGGIPVQGELGSTVRVKFSPTDLDPNHPCRRKLNSNSQMWRSTRHNHQVHIRKLRVIISVDPQDYLHPLTKQTSSPSVLVDPTTTSAMQVEVSIHINMLRTALQSRKRTLGMLSSIK